MPATTDRHVSGAMVRIPKDIHQQLKALADRNARPLTWELRLALVEHLRANGLWPPPEGEGD